MAARSSSSRARRSPRSRPDNFEASITVRERAALIYGAITHERSAWERSSHTAKMRGGVLTISVRAQDATALKATMLSLIKHIELAHTLADENAKR